MIWLFFIVFSSKTQFMKTSKPTENPRILQIMIENISSTRYDILKESQHMRFSSRYDQISQKQIARIRNSMYEVMSDILISEEDSAIKHIIHIEEPVLIKCIMILRHIGFSNEVIADLVCINRTYCNQLSHQIIQEHPEIFK